MSKTRNKRNRKNNYTRKQYQSNDGMLTSVWGPGAWHFLHTISFNYPVKPRCEEKRHYRNYVLNLIHVLHCGKCRENLCKNLKRHPLMYKHMKSRVTFSRYIYKLHEIINEMLGKKSGLSYIEVRDRYENFRSRCRTTIKRKRHTEKGCVEPVYGEKAKCVLKIVPDTKKCETFQIEEKCKNKFD
jgi:hypothetical protein